MSGFERKVRRNRIRWMRQQIRKQAIREEPHDDTIQSIMQVAAELGIDHREMEFPPTQLHAMEMLLRLIRQRDQMQATLLKVRGAHD